MAVNSFNAQNPPVNTKGDLFTFSTIPTRLAVGSNNTVLTADSSTATGLKWATPSSTPTFIGCAAYKNASAQSLSNNTDTAITLDAEEYDTDGFHSTSSNTSRMTIPTGKGGKYLLTGNIAYAGNNTGVRAIRFTKNGAGVGGYVYVAANSVSAESTFLNCAQIVEGSAGDYFELYGYQGSGGALNVTANQAATRFSIQYLGA